MQRHPEIVIIDSLDNVRKVLDRYRQYKIIEDSELAIEDGVFTPTFVEITSTDVNENLRKMQAANVKFPFVCKPLLAHGTKLAHKMSIIFNETGLKSINPPCVAQTFINHNARLFKLFIVRDKYFVIERPSIKNFKPNYNCETVHFDSHDISKPYSSSALTELDEEDAKTCSITEPDKERLDRIVNVISGELGLFLLGIDVIIENATGRYAIIDMNSFPGYDGVDNFLDLYSDIVIEEIEAARQRPDCAPKPEALASGCPLHTSNSSPDTNSCLAKQYNQTDQQNGPTLNGDNGGKAPNGVYSPNDFDSGIDTSDSCDERKNPKSEIGIKKRQHCRVVTQQPVVHKRDSDQKDPV